VYDARTTSPPAQGRDEQQWPPHLRLSLRLDALVWALTSLMLVAEEPNIVVPFVSMGTPRNIPGQNSERL
jgi:hypothetical protein